jgi:hypothetical protein
MLSIRAEQFEKFNENEFQHFLEEELSTYLKDRNPSFLPRFPEEQQRLIVENMVKQAQYYGATWKSSISLFCDLMQNISATFYLQKEINDWMSNDFVAGDHLIKSLSDNISDVAWAQAQQQISTLALYIPPTLNRASLQSKIAVALPLVYWDISTEAAKKIAPQAIVSASQWGLSELDDAPLAITAWRYLYGEQYANIKEYPWVTDVFKQSVSATERLSLLKFRIALDHGRFI